MKTIEHDCSRYHPREGERALCAGDPDPGEGWFDSPGAAGLIGVSDGYGTRFVSPPPGLDPLDHDGDGQKGGSMPELPPIPVDWRKLHHLKRLALARALGVSVKTVAEADAELERRKA